MATGTIANAICRAIIFHALCGSRGNHLKAKNSSKAQSWNECAIIPSSPVGSEGITFAK